MHFFKVDSQAFIIKGDVTSHIIGSIHPVIIAYTHVECFDYFPNTIVITYFLFSFILLFCYLFIPYQQSSPNYLLPC